MKRYGLIAILCSMAMLSGCGLLHKAKNADEIGAETSMAMETEMETEPELETSTEDTDYSASNFIYAHDYNLKQQENQDVQNLKRDDTGSVSKNGYRLVETERDSLPASAVIGADSVLYTVAETTEDAGTDTGTTTGKETKQETTAAPQIIYVERTTAAAETTKAAQKETKSAGEKGTNIPGESETHEVVPYAVQNEFADGKQMLIQDLPTEQK